MEPFVMINQSEVNALLDEAIEVAAKWEGNLAPGDTDRGKGENALRSLKEGKIALENPQADIKLLPEASNDYKYYAIPVPVILWPGRGAEYRLVECGLEFEVLEDTVDDAIAIQRIFPEPVWKPVLALGGCTHLAVDNALEWGIELKGVELQLEELEVALRTRVAQDITAAGFVKIFPFDFTLGRADIVAQGAGKQALWRLDSEQVIREQQQVRFVVLLKTPLTLNCIRLRAVTYAEVNYSWLVMHVRHLWNYFSTAFQDWVETRGQDPQKRIGLQDIQEWDLKLRKLEN